MNFSAHSSIVLELSKNVVASVSHRPKTHYFWKIRLTPDGIFEKSEQLKNIVRRDTYLSTIMGIHASNNLTFKTQ